jgi:hypothetical protein
MFQKLTILLFILFISTQCTLEKRLYNKGYSLSWNKKHHRQTGEGSEGELEERKARYQLTDSVLDLAEEASLNDQEMSADDTDLDYEPTGIAEEPQTSPVSDTVYIDHVYVPSGVASFGVLGGAALSFGIAVTFVFDVFFFIALALLIASFVLGIISVIEFKRNRKSYVYNSFGVIALVIDVLILGVIGFFVLILVAFF